MISFINLNYEKNNFINKSLNEFNAFIMFYLNFLFKPLPFNCSWMDFNETFQNKAYILHLEDFKVLPKYLHYLSRYQTVINGQPLCGSLNNACFECPYKSMLTFIDSCFSHLPFSWSSMDFDETFHNKTLILHIDDSKVSSKSIH